MSNLLHVPADHALNRLDPALRARFIKAQGEMIDMEFRTAGDLLRRVFDDLKLKLTAPAPIASQPVGAVADLAYKDLCPFFAEMLRASGVPDQANRRQAANLAHRVQLLRAFSEPDRIVGETVAKVSAIVAGFPRSAEHIQRGRNPGDVLDPYILAASQQLVYGGDLEGTFTATVAHKILMMIEGLLGHLHEA